MQQSGLGEGLTVVRRMPMHVQRGVSAPPTLSDKAHYRLRDLEHAARTSVREAAVAVGVPVSTIYRWRNRYDPKDLTTLEPRCRRPRTPRMQQWTAAQEQAVLALRQPHPRTPVPVQAIQVDEGSELMAEFESVCQAREIALDVVPPRSPKLNWRVERLNGTSRWEFWECYAGDLDLPTVR